MTCVVGLIHNKEIYIGADSAGVGGYELVVRSDSKVFINDDIIFGFTSSFRMGQLLRYMSIPKYHSDIDIYEYMVTEFINSVRKCLSDGGFAKKENEQEEGGIFLVGFKGRLFEIESDYQVGELLIPYNAIGCGRNYALGSLYSTSLKEPRDIIIQALKAAEKFSAGVRGPFNVLSIW